MTRVLVRPNSSTPAAPGTPTLTMTALSVSEIRYTPGGTAPSGWREWELQISTVSSTGPWTDLGTFSQTLMPRVVSGLAAGTQHWGRVRGTTNTGQVSAYSSAATATTSSSGFTFAPGYPRLAYQPLNNWPAYTSPAFKAHAKKMHVLLVTHFNQQQSQMGVTMRSIFDEIKTGKDTSMSVTPLCGIYYPNNENLADFVSDSATQRERDWLNANFGWLYTSGIAGSPVVSTFESNLWLTNNTRFGPVDGSGDNYIRWLNRIKLQQNVFGEPGNSPNDLCDFLYLDNVFQKFRADADYNRDSITDSRDDPVTALWQREGLYDALVDLSQRWPGHMLLGNIADWPDRGNTVPADVAPLNGLLHGGLMEGLIGESWSVDNWGGFAEMMRWYRFMEDATLSPKVNIFGARISSPTAYREMRRALCACLVGGDAYAYIYSAGYSASEQLFFDEYNNVGAGLEYLGAATESRATGGTVGTGNAVWRRTHTNGVAYVNPTGSDVTVTAHRALKRINGTQDSVVNSGATIANGATFTVKANDGLILLNN